VLDNFGDRLAHAVRAKRSTVCVGLDPRIASLPTGFLESAKPSHVLAAEAYCAFSCAIIDVVADLVPIVKPQVAFFEQLGAPGMQALADTIQYALDRGLLVIADAKRNDIGTTAEAYAAAFLGRGEASAWGSDSLTVSPYLGDDSLQPFVDRCKTTGSGLFVLVKTSNPGSGFIQDLKVDSLSISQRMADWVQKESLAQIGSSGYGPIGAVVGATYPDELVELRARMPNAWLLIPGYGAQGGGAKDVAAAFQNDGLGAVVNNSRGIIFAHASAKYRHHTDWQRAVEAATRDMIDDLRAECPPL
jgi:orotidine-5'-phosphate decarboxylase